MLICAVGCTCGTTVLVTWTNIYVMCVHISLTKQQFVVSHRYTALQKTEYNLIHEHLSTSCFQNVKLSVWRSRWLRLPGFMDNRHIKVVSCANILKKQWRTADKGWSSSLGLGEVLTTPHCIIHRSLET